MAIGPSGNPGDKGGVSNIPSGDPGTPGHPPPDNTKPETMHPSAKPRKVG